MTHAVFGVFLPAQTPWTVRQRLEARLTLAFVILASIVYLQVAIRTVQGACVRALPPRARSAA